MIDAMAPDDVAAVASIASCLHVDESQLREELVRPWSATLVAREPGAGVVAFVVAWRVADEIHILQIGTREDRRRRGIARALMEHVLADAQRVGIRHAFLEARLSNTPAIDFYRSLGFALGRIRKGYYSDGEDAVEMMLELP
jgi:ribosomal-protein-alanine N-acetyltransferase